MKAESRYAKLKVEDPEAYARLKAKWREKWHHRKATNPAAHAKAAAMAHLRYHNKRVAGGYPPPVLRPRLTLLSPEERKSRKLAYNKAWKARNKERVRLEREAAGLPALRTRPYKLTPEQRRINQISHMKKWKAKNEAVVQAYHRKYNKAHRSELAANQNRYHERRRGAALLSVVRRVTKTLNTGDSYAV